MKTNMEELETWLKAHKAEITHFRPRRWCGVEMLHAYNRRQSIPFLDGQPYMSDTPEVTTLIRRILGEGKLEDRFTPHPGSNNY